MYSNYHEDFEAVIKDKSTYPKVDQCECCLRENKYWKDMSPKSQWYIKLLIAAELSLVTISFQMLGQSLIFDTLKLGDLISSSGIHTENVYIQDLMV